MYLFIIFSLTGSSALQGWPDSRGITRVGGGRGVAVDEAVTVVPVRVQATVRRSRWIVGGAG